MTMEHLRNEDRAAAIVGGPSKPIKISSLGPLNEDPSKVPTLTVTEGPRPQENLLYRNLDAIATPVIVIGQNQAVVYDNQACQKNLLPDDFAALVANFYGSSVETEWGSLSPIEAITTRRIDHYREIVNVVKNGQFFDVTILPAARPNGEIDAIVSVSDITASKEIAALRRTNKQLQDHVRERRHDIRGKLSIARAYTQVLLRSEPLSEEQRSYAANVLNAITETTTITEAVSAELEELKNLKKEPTDLVKLVEELASCKVFARRVNDEERMVNLTYECTTPEEPQLGNMDPNKLKVALANFMDNALDAVAEKDEKIFKVSLTIMGNDAFISIEDNGDGMSPEVYNKAVVRREKGPEVTTKGILGNGLGISIALEIIGAHGGDTKFEFSQDGTKVTVHLPLKEVK